MANFFKSVSTLFTGTVIGQAVNLLAYPVIARTYDAPAFGSFAIFLSTASILGTVACLRFDVVVQAAPFSQRQSVHRLGVVIAAVISLLTAAFYLLLVPFEWRTSVPYAGALALAIFLTGYSLSAQALLIKHERYRVTAAAAVLRTVFTALPQILLFWFMPGPFGLIAGYCVGAAFQSAMQLYALAEVPSRKVSVRRMLALLMRYRVFPLFDVPSALVATASLYAGNYVVFALYGAASAGIYAMAFRLATLPLSLVGSNLSEVFFQKASKDYSEGTPIWPLMLTTLGAAGIFAAAMLVGIVLLSGPVIHLYLGSKWALVSYVLIALAPMMCMRLLAVAVGSTPLVLRRPQWSLISNLLLFSVLAAASLLAWIKEIGLIDFLWITSLGSSGVYAGFIIILMRIVKSQASAANIPRISSGEG